jgi:hypothetical protein
MEMESGFKSGFTGDVRIIQNRYTKKAGVQMYFGTSESLYINQVFGRE